MKRFGKEAVERALARYAKYRADPDRALTGDELRARIRERRGEEWMAALGEIEVRVSLTDVDEVKALVEAVQRFHDWFIEQPVPPELEGTQWDWREPDCFGGHGAVLGECLRALKRDEEVD